MISDDKKIEKTATTKFLKAQGLDKGQIEAIRLFIDKKQKAAASNAVFLTIIVMVLVYVLSR